MLLRTGSFEIEAQTFTHIFLRLGRFQIWTETVSYKPGDKLVDLVREPNGIDCVETEGYR